MAKQFKRSALKNPALKTPALKATVLKTPGLKPTVLKVTAFKKASVNGHGLSHDEGFAGDEGEFEPAAVARHDDDVVPAAEHDLDWDDDEEDHDPHGDADAHVDATDDPVRMYLM